MNLTLQLEKPEIPATSIATDFWDEPASFDARALASGIHDLESIEAIARNGYYASQVIAQLRKDFGLNRASAITNARTLLNLAMPLAKPKDKEYLHTQNIAVFLDEGRLEAARNGLLRNVNIHMKSSHLMLAARWSRMRGSRTNTNFFWELYQQREENPSLAFTYDDVRRIRLALSTNQNDENFFDFQRNESEKFPPLINEPIAVIGFSNVCLIQILSPKYLNRVIHYLKNCLNRYRSAIKEGRATILCLEVDGVPTEAIQIDRSKNRVIQWAGKFNCAPNDQYRGAVIATLADLGVQGQ